MAALKISECPRKDLKLVGFSYFLFEEIIYSLRSKLGLATDFKTNQIKYAHMT